jgi:hypothetical protein
MPVTYKLRPPVRQGLRVVVGNRDLDSTLLWAPALSHFTTRVQDVLPTGFKRAMVRAAKPIEGLSQTSVNQCVFVQDDTTCKRPWYCRGVSRRSRPVRVGRDVRLRPYTEFERWQYRFEIIFDADMFSAEEVLNLLARSGVVSGAGAQRVEHGYNHGMYRILRASPFAVA